MTWHCETAIYLLSLGSYHIPCQMTVAAPSSPSTAPASSDPIHILCSTDDCYAPWCGVMLTSLLENLKGRRAEIHLIDDGISERHLARFKQLEERYGCEISLIVPSDAQLAKLPESANGWPRASYLRMLVTELLPPSIHRVIYLDVDMAVDTSVEPLWELDLQGNACAVVPDGPVQIGYQPRNEMLGLKSRYFNSGMMVIDLDAFRKFDIAAKGVEMLHRVKPEMDLPDQDILNILLDGNHLDLSTRWNIRSSLYQTIHQEPVGADKEEASKVRRGRLRGIIHYTSILKPWKNDLNDFHPLEHIWRRYHRKSLWADTPLIPARLPLRARLARWRHAFAYRHGLPSAFLSPWAHR